MILESHPPPTIFEEAIDHVHAEQRAILLDKQRKYGRGNIQEFGLFGVILRMNDKLARLKEMVCKPTLAGVPVLDDHGESIEDTLLDTSNYGTIALLVRRGWWDLPNKEG